MNQKNSLGLNKCFLDLDNPFELFQKWFEEAKKKEINDPNALALGTANKQGIPSVRMVLLKGHSEKGFVFYTNLNSQKGNEIKENPNATMCFHWKSLLRQIRIVGKLKQVDDKTADEYYNSRAYESRIGAWASKQSSFLENRNELLENEEKEIKIIGTFLPKQLNEEETKKICRDVIESVGASSMKDMGKIMSVLKSKHSDSLDFSKVSSIIKEFLSK